MGRAALLQQTGGVQVFVGLWGLRVGAEASCHFQEAALAMRMQTLNPSGDLRCECGKLLARVVRQVVELKCSRCKRVVLVANGRTYADPGHPPCTCCASPSLQTD